jgi:hypothetical protein
VQGKAKKEEKEKQDCAALRHSLKDQAPLSPIQWKRVSQFATHDG